jgi:hypothetical protein
MDILREAAAARNSAKRIWPVAQILPEPRAGSSSSRSVRRPCRDAQAAVVSLPMPTGSGLIAQGGVLTVAVLCPDAPQKRFSRPPGFEHPPNAKLPRNRFQPC